MSPTFSEEARRFGIASAYTLAGLLAAYAILLATGLLTLPSPNDPIGDPIFSLLEILILLTAPVMMGLMVALHAWAPPRSKALTLAALVFISLVAGLTCCVHFAILVLSRHPVIATNPAAPLFLSFRWPSAAYAFDILAWDFFFPLSMFYAAPAVRGGRLATAARNLLVASGAFALAGLAGVWTGNMSIRNIGIVGYVPLFLVSAILLGALFRRTPPAPTARID